jgi:competence ComEA-like helix-hairpin-helix protein
MTSLSLRAGGSRRTVRDETGRCPASNTNVQEDSTMKGHDKRNARQGFGRLAAAGLVAMAMMFAVGAEAVAAPGGAPAAASSEASGKVDVNSASAAELASLPGIGDSKAAAIIAEREKKPFASVDDLERVRGIGARTVEDLRSKVSVGSR